MIEDKTARIRHRRAKGFTLVELLVVMTLFGLLSLALVGGLRFGTRAWEAGAARGQALSEIEIMQGVIRRQLGEVIQPELEGAETPESVIFAGAADSLELFTYFPGHRGVGGRNYFRLAILPNDKLMRLDLSWRLYRADGSLYENPGDDGDSGEERQLIVGIESAEFSYFGASDRDREPDWQDRWDLEEKLPDLVALRITFPPGDRRYWPELIVAPRLATQRVR